MHAYKYLAPLFMAGLMISGQAMAAKEAPAANDDAARALAQKSGCFACHSVDKKIMGPAWKDVAAKYRGDKKAEAALVSKVSKGGVGVWGTIAMPPQAPKVPEADIKTLVKFVLSLK